MSILVKIEGNFDFNPTFEECRLRSKLTKLSILDKTEENVVFSHFFKKTPIFLKISENLNFVKIIKKCWFGNIDFGEIVEKSEIWSKLSEKLHFGKNCRKFSILVKTYQNVEFGQNQR